MPNNPFLEEVSVASRDDVPVPEGSKLTRCIFVNKVGTSPLWNAGRFPTRSDR